MTAAYVGGTRLPAERVRAEGDSLVIELPVGEGADLIILSRPLRAPDDDRQLGLPIRSIELGTA